jgi:hypothetical protein
VNRHEKKNSSTVYPSFSGNNNRAANLRPNHLRSRFLGYKGADAISPKQFGASLTTDRQQFRAVTLNDQIYVIGGEYFHWNVGGGLMEETPLALNELYTPTGYIAPEKTLPEISLESPLNLTYNSSSVPLTFIVDKTIATASFSLNNQPNVTVTGNTTIDNLPNGAYNLTVYATDTYGNVGNQTVNFTVKTQESFGSVADILAIAVAAIIIGVSLGILRNKRHNQNKMELN